MIKILFLEADPRIAELPAHEKEPDHKTEFDAINEEIARLGSGNRLHFVRASHVRPATLPEYLRTEAPHVVHFSGHGVEQGGLLFEDENGLPVVVQGDKLAEVFRAEPGHDWRVRCVVLNACYTDKVAEDLAVFVPCVVGMTNVIPAASVAAFAIGFYLAVGAGVNVKEAVEEGRKRIRLTQYGVARGDWDLPRVRAIQVDTWIYNILRGQEVATSNAKRLLHNKYAFVETLGNGPIARTDVMLDVQLERRVVVKTLVEPAARASFVDEVRDLVQVSKHPNIVSIYTSRLHDEPPHYVREYVKGDTLREWLNDVGQAGLSIDFVHQVLTALGEAMAFAMNTGVWDLGVVPEKVLIQEKGSGLRRGLPSEYHVVICPGPGGSKYIRSKAGGGKYAPPEYKQPRMADDPYRANQYRLGILGYEMLIGSVAFLEEVSKQKGDRWRRVDEVDPTRRCPSFLSRAIETMIDPEPGRRYPSFDEAVEAIAHRNLYVEVAGDSFARILNKDERDGRNFFLKFYNELLGLPGVATVFHGRPTEELHCPPGASFGKAWEKQFDKLKEAIIFLLSFNLLRETETGGRTVLTGIAEQHSSFVGMASDYYDHFGTTLIKTVKEYDEGGGKPDLEVAWRQAISPGLEYLKKHHRPGPPPARPGGPAVGGGLRRAGVVPRAEAETTEASPGGLQGGDRGP
jgi:serine/threonine protein kinase